MKKEQLKSIYSRSQWKGSTIFPDTRMGYHSSQKILARLTIQYKLNSINLLEKYYDVFSVTSNSGNKEPITTLYEQGGRMKFSKEVLWQYIVKSGYHQQDTD